MPATEIMRQPELKAEAMEMPAAPAKTYTPTSAEQPVCLTPKLKTKPDICLSVLLSKWLPSQ